MSEEGTFLVAAVVLAFRGDRLLALKRAAASDAFAGEWEAISGRLAPGEDPLAAARREAREETGLAVELDPRPVACYALERAGRPTIAVVFRGEAAGGGEVVLSPEHEAWRSRPSRSSPRSAASRRSSPRRARRASWASRRAAIAIRRRSGRSSSFF
jgi:8-oxo-dGTP pyrophosphatase MutT (NUDIX family)